MRNTAGLTVTTPTEKEIVMTREFAAPRRLVFEALTTPALLQRWLLGPPGWSMVVCDVDLTVGGAYRYVWRNTNGTEMGMGGVYLEIAGPERLVQTEKFDESWYAGEAVDTSVLVEKGGTTTLTLTVLYESKEARDTAIKSDMEKGVAASYDRLEEQLKSSMKGSK